MATYQYLETNDWSPNLASAAERFWDKVDFGKDENSCWLWTGAILHNGYGQFWYCGSPKKAHRWAYEYVVGPVPEGLVLDHLCRTRHYVNPRHLEPVAEIVNIRRGIQCQATHCLRGHEFTDLNTYRRPGSPGRRECRACARERDSRYRQKRRGDG